MTKKRKIIKISLTVLLTLGSVIMIAPVIWMISSSLKFEGDVFNFPIEWIPKAFTSLNYEKAFNDFPYLQWYTNTIKITLFNVVGTVVVCSMAGFAFAKINFTGKKYIFFFYIATLMIPVQVRIIPQFMLYRELDLINKHWAVILPWVMFNGFGIFYMRQSFMSLPDELIEAARIDGCTNTKIYLKIALPLAKSSLIALAILAFIWSWNDYLGPLIYLTDSTKQVLSVGIASFKAQYSTNFALQMAGATLALIPVIIVYLIAQKYFIEGVAQSGMKE